MSINAASHSTRMTIGTVGNATGSAATGSAVGAAHGRDRNTPGNGDIPTGHPDSPLLTAPVAGMARSYKKTVGLPELQPRIFPRPGQHR